VLCREALAMGLNRDDLIDDRITYLTVRVDPDKVVPLMDEATSRAYLAERQ